MTEDMDLNRLYNFCQTSLDNMNTDRFRWYGCIERTENGIIPKQIVIARMGEGEEEVSVKRKLKNMKRI